MSFISRFIVCILVLCCGLVGGSLQAQQLVPRLVRHFSEVPAVNLKAGAMAQDAQGHLWIAAEEGMVRFDGQQFRTVHDPVVKQGDYYYHVAPARQGRLWLKMGTGYSLSYVDAGQQRIVRLPDTTRLVREYLARYGCHYIFADTGGTLWIGLKKHGLLRFIPQTGAVTHVVDRPLDIRGITQDRRGVIYFATTDQGLFAYAPQTGQLTNYRHNDQDTTSLTSNATRGVQARPDGSILVGLINEVNVFTPATGRFRPLLLNAVRSDNPLLGSYVFDFQLDGQGNAYFSTGPATFRYSAGGKLERMALIAPTDYVEALYVSPANRLWISANASLYEYDLNRARVVPSLILLSVVVNGTRLENNSTDNRRLVYDSLGHPTLTVPENEPFSIRFSLTAGKRPLPIRHQLEGYDRRWLVSENVEGNADYQLPAGRYTFRVNRDQRTGGLGATAATMTVIVVPPFWKTMPVVLTALLLLGGLGYYLIRAYYRRRQLRQQLAREQLEAANLRHLDELKTRFFGNVTHEFRTPLTLILHATEQLVGQPTTDWQRERLSTINRNADQLARLITQMLDIAKMDAQKLDIQPKLGDLILFIGQCVDGFADLASQRRVQLIFNSLAPNGAIAEDGLTDSDLAERLRPFDDDKMGKILYNLLSNALKFTPEGGSIRVSSSFTADGQVVVRVQDTGIGIAADQLDRIFDRFYQADASTTRRYEGTGIGLAYVRELTGLLGGRVTVESTLGIGTTFTVTLPLAAAVGELTNPLPTTPPVTGQPLRQPAEADEFGPTTDKPLVLLVEDNQELRSYMAGQLRPTYRVLEAGNGRAGIDQALATIPDLIVTDVMMPDVDGYTLVETLKRDERTSHVPIIVLTAKSSFDSRMQGLYAGADDYLSKPFSFAELHTRIRNVLLTRRHWQQHLTAGQPLSITNTASVPPVGNLMPDRERQFLARLRESILANLTNEVVDVDWLVAQARMSRAQLHRKLTALTSLTTTGFIHSVRLGKAQELLQTDGDELTVAEVAYRVGYSSPAYFSKVFSDHFGYPPARMKV